MYQCVCVCVCAVNACVHYQTLYLDSETQYTQPILKWLRVFEMQLHIRFEEQASMARHDTYARSRSFTRSSTMQFTVATLAE